MKVIMVGIGYVGLVSGACIANMGHTVTCIDKDCSKVEMLKNGKLPIYEPGLDELIEENTKRKRLFFTSDYKKEYKNAEVIFIAVGTPENSDGSVNLEYIYECCREIAENIEKNCIITVRSTVPIGTTEAIEKFIKENLVNEVSIEVAVNPEFLSQGSAISDTLNANRIVIGTESELALETLKKIYKEFDIPIVVSDRKSVEMIKYTANNFLALKISYINEIANLCELIGANIDDVVAGIRLDSRIGSSFLRPGVGFGGSCLPKDTKALQWLGRSYGLDMKTIDATIKINEEQKYKLYKKAKEENGNLNNVNIAILGITFKPCTDDLRNAPAVSNIIRLLKDGANISVYDPLGMDKLKELFGGKIEYSSTPQSAIKGKEIAFIFTEWDEIKKMKAEEYKMLMKNAVVYDGRNCIKKEDAIRNKIKYYAIGR